MSKKRPRLFERLKTALEDVRAYERGEKVLRVSTVPIPPPPRDYGAPEIKGLRERLRLSQGAFASLLHVSVKTVQGWEQGVRSPSHSAARLLQFIEEPATFEKALVGLVTLSSTPPAGQRRD